jgi:hypothetical protein
MASPTKKTRLIRTRKKRKCGQDGRADRRNNGTTRSAEELFGDKN